jgi:hypothetical protein
MNISYFKLEGSQPDSPRIPNVAPFWRGGGGGAKKIHFWGATGQRVFKKKYSVISWSSDLKLMEE